MTQFRFTCPKCDEHELVEIMLDVTVSSIVTVIDDIEPLEYGDQVNEDGVVSRYQCGRCGYVVAGALEALLTSGALSPRPTGVSNE